MTAIQYQNYRSTKRTSVFIYQYFGVRNETLDIDSNIEKCCSCYFIVIMEQLIKYCFYNVKTIVIF